MLGFLTHIPLQQQRWEKHLESAEYVQNGTSLAQLMKEHTEAQLWFTLFQVQNHLPSQVHIAISFCSYEPLSAPEGTQI